MRTYLNTMRAGLQRLLDDPVELNRMSWSAYLSVQGKKSAKKADEQTNNVTDPTQLKNFVGDVDRTLYYDESLETSLNGLSSSGAPMMAVSSPNELYDIAPCLRQHIETLRTMSEEWCKGFATSERHALVMLYWLNEQGRNWTEDLLLINSKTHLPDYDQIVVHVPLNIDFHTKPIKRKVVASADEDTSIRSSLSDIPQDVHATYTVTYPVGLWSGPAQASSVTRPAQYSWGWGHVPTYCAITTA